MGFSIYLYDNIFILKHSLPYDMHHEICTRLCCSLFGCGYIMRSLWFMPLINHTLEYTSLRLETAPVSVKWPRTIRVKQSITHWGRVTHICVGKLTIIGSDNGLSPGRRQAIIWTNAGILLIEPLGTNSSEILIGIQIFSFKKMSLKMSSGKWRPFCLGLNVITKHNKTKQSVNHVHNSGDVLYLIQKEIL